MVQIMLEIVVLFYAHVLPYDDMLKRDPLLQAMKSTTKQVVSFCYFAIVHVGK